MATPTRDEVIEWLGRASFSGRLGLFVGTGFSIAATKHAAPSFELLLKKTAEKLGLTSDFATEQFKLRSLPQIATELLGQLERTGKKSEEADALFRQTIADLVNLVPHEDEHARFEAALLHAAPSWVITTNYDLILESLVARCRTVMPHDVVFPSKKLVPIYHLHGHRHSPETICVTEEDYVSLLAPIDYQRLKLPLLFLESTTLLLGYALGDINVRAAMEWSRSFQGADGLKLEKPSGLVVQALFNPDPSPQPRIGASGEIIVEIDDIPKFLEEVGESAAEFDRYDAYMEADFKRFFATAKPEDIAVVGPVRDEFLGIVETAAGAVSPKEFVEFLSRATEPIWAMARQVNHFPYYDEYLSVFMEILRKLRYREANPNIVAYLARSLNRVGLYFDEDESKGSAWDATRRWKREAPALPIPLLRELNSFGKTNELKGLVAMMNCSTVKPLLA